MYTNNHTPAIFSHCRAYIVAAVCSIVAACWMLWFFPRSSFANHGSSQQTASAIEPDPRAQALLRDFMSAVEESDGCRIWKTLEALRSFGGSSGARLIPQLVYMSAYAEQMREAFAPIMVAKMLGLSGSKIVAALVPYLGVDDPKVANAVREWLKANDNVGRFDPEDRFSAYEHFFYGMATRGEQPPAALVRYLYGRQPGAAMLLLNRVTFNRGKGPVASRASRRKAILWAEHVISDTIWKHRHGFLDEDRVEPQAAKELEKLARRKEWWVRLYVAEIMRQHPAFRRPALIRHLAKDDHPLVRESIEAILAEKDRPARP